MRLSALLLALTDAAAAAPSRIWLTDVLGLLSAWQQPHAAVGEHLYCCYHWTCCAACGVAWAVLRPILEEAKGATVKVQQHAHTIALHAAWSGLPHRRYSCRCLMPMEMQSTFSNISSTSN
jgi:hypothetical protein